MASPKIKATYALDVETVRTLERTARQWKVSKSEALRRAIHSIAGRGAPADDPLHALDALQHALQLTSGKADSWEARTRRERRAASKRREP